jgi:Protein of unknown function (DUF3617)
MRTILLVFGLSVSASAAMFVSGEGKVEPRPGLWSYEIEVEKFVATGIPPDRLEEVKAAFLRKYVHSGGESCLTAEDARKAFSRESFRIEGFGSGECRFDRSEAEGERVDLAGACRSGRLSRDFAVTGDKTPEKIDLLVKYDDRAPAEGVRIQSEIRMAARWTAECSASQPGLALPDQQPSELAAAQDAAGEAANGAAVMADPPEASSGNDPAAAAAPMVDVSGY